MRGPLPKTLILFMTNVWSKYDQNLTRPTNNKTRNNGAEIYNSSSSIAYGLRVQYRRRGNKWATYSLSRKTVNTRENFWNVYCFATNQMRDETATDNRQNRSMEWSRLDTKNNELFLPSYVTSKKPQKTKRISGFASTLRTLTRIYVESTTTPVPLTSSCHSYMERSSSPLSTPKKVIGM